MSDIPKEIWKGLGTVKSVVEAHLSINEGKQNFIHDISSLREAIGNLSQTPEGTVALMGIISAVLNCQFEKTWRLYATDEHGRVEPMMFSDSNVRKLIQSLALDR